MLGWLPEDVDRCSFRDLALAFRGARAKQKRQWQHTASVMAAIHNWAGPRGQDFKAKSPQDLVPGAFDEVKKESVQMTKAQIAAVLGAGARKVKPKPKK
jgi:hypothetical protein